MNIAGGFQGISVLLWLALIGLIVLAVLRVSRGLQVRGMVPVILVVAVAAVVVSSASSGLVFIEPQERGVVISALTPTGYRDQPLGAGLHWIVPFFEYVKRYPISKETYTMSIADTEGQVQGDDSVAARTLDGQEIFVDASAIYQIDPAKVVQVHITWQDRYTDQLVRPLVRGIIRDVVSQLRVDEVVSTKRMAMTQQITEQMNKRLEENGLMLSDFVLRNITFSKEYAASVEQKQIAEQQAQQARFVVESKKQEAQQAIETSKGAAESVKIRADGDAQARLIQAQAEAKALQMIADALKSNPDLLTYNYINKLAPGIEVMLVPNNTPYLLPLPGNITSGGTASGTTTIIPTPAAPLTSTTTNPN